MPTLRDYIKAGRAEIKADRVIRNGKLVNVASEEIYPADIAIYGERIMAVGDVAPYLGKDTEVIDAGGAYLCPGGGAARPHGDRHRPRPDPRSGRRGGGSRIP